ncbi:DUF3391 domain-containing protein [Porticoccaceae bacterium LTM1]|nr:DUF3391 domain-containing protein [Porticoccaceae bacterium LTM1]
MMTHSFQRRTDLKRVAIDELKLGMYVAELDRPWLGTPFIVQGFALTEMREIMQLAECCNYVWIDPARSVHVRGGYAAVVDRDHDSPDGPKKSAKSKKESQKNDSGPDKNIPDLGLPVCEVSVYLEHSVARQIYLDASEGVRTIFTGARDSGVIDLPQAKNIIREIGSSLDRNHNAMLWMTRLQPVAGKRAKHAINTAILAIALAKYMKLSNVEIELIGLCGLFHDIGECRLPPHLLKSNYTMTEAEQEFYRMHTEAGHDLLQECEEMSDFVMRTALHHHERLDGKGYPKGLKGAEIDRFTRMISIVSTYEILAGGSMGGKAIPPKAVLREIYQSRGKRFDAALAVNFVNMIGPYPPGTLVELLNGSVAAVVSAPEKAGEMPVANIVHDQEGDLFEPRRVKLSRPESLDEQGLAVQRVLLSGVNTDLGIESYSILPMMDPAFSA